MTYSDSWQFAILFSICIVLLLLAGWLGHDDDIP